MIFFVGKEITVLSGYSDADSRFHSLERLLLYVRMSKWAGCKAHEGEATAAYWRM